MALAWVAAVNIAFYAIAAARILSKIPGSAFR
jgi:hypothetical protein